MVVKTLYAEDLKNLTIVGTNPEPGFICGIGTIRGGVASDPQDCHGLHEDSLDDEDLKEWLAE